MHFERITYKDLDEIRGLQPEDWPDIIPEFEFYIKSPFCKPIMTKEKDKIIGIGSFIKFNTTSWIGHMIVDKNSRQRGIGYQILKELLENLNEYSIETCLLIASELGKPVYSKAGFQHVTEYFFMQREKPWKARSMDKNVNAFQEAYRSMIYDLDKIVSGENRERLLTNYLNDSLIYLNNNKVLGYYIPKLKEGLIIADTEEAGIALMEVKYAAVDKAVLPVDNVAGIKFLHQNGFVKTTKKGTRMIYGKEIHWEPKKLFSRIGGNFG